MSAFQDLAAEVCRIQDCPYVPNLKQLHDILEATDSSQIQRWARGNGCQIEALAEAVLEGLELWPFVLDILKLLSCITSFRDAVLSQKPMLLDTLLGKALESEHGYCKFSSTCVSLLSSPLDIAIPSTYPRFLEKTLGHAAQNLSADTIRPIHCMLSALGPTYVNILPPSLLHLVQDEMIKVLSSKFEKEDQTLQLLCLAVLAKLIPRKHSDSDPCGTRSLPAHSQSLDALSRIFAPSQKFFSMTMRAHKTLDMVVFQCILVCSGNHILSHSEGLERLKLAEEIADAVDDKERHSWNAKNKVKAKKLYEKIVRQDLDSEQRSSAFNFVCALSDEHALPKELVSAFKSCLLTTSTLTLSTRAMRSWIIYLDLPSIVQLLTSLLNRSCGRDPTTLDSSVELDNALHIVNIMIVTVPRSQALCQAILQTWSGKEVLEKVQQFAAQDPIQPRPISVHNVLNPCLSTCTEAQIRLHQRLCVLLLRCPMHSPEDGQGFQLSTLDALLEKQTRLAVPTAQCAKHCFRRKVADGSRVSLFEAGSTPEAKSVSHGWREKLVKEMSRDANYRYGSIIRMVGDICRDLELRCDEAERPFREEQSKALDLQARLDTAHQKIIELEAAIQDRSNSHSDIEKENTRLLEQSRLGEGRLQDLSASLDALYQEIDQAKSEAARAADAASESARQQDLAYLATLTGKDEIYEEQTARMALIEARANDLERELDQMRRENTVHIRTLQDKDRAINELQKALSNAESLTELEQTKVHDLLEGKATLLASKTDLEYRLRESSEESETLVSKLRAQIGSAKVETAKLQNDYEEDAASKAAEIRHLDESHREAVQELRADLDDTHHNASLAMEKSQSTIVKLQKENKRLCLEREKHSEALADAKELRNKLMAVVGITSDHASSSVGMHVTSEQIHTDHKDGKTKRSDQSTTASFSSEVSSGTRGPPPKRNKTHRSSNSPQTTGNNEMRTGTVAKGSRRHTMKCFRTPLANLTVTQSRVLSTPTQTQRGKAFVPLEGVSEKSGPEQMVISDEEDFGGGDLFTSTDQELLSALKRQPRHVDDDTTVDF